MIKYRIFQIPFDVGELLFLNDSMFRRNHGI